MKPHNWERETEGPRAGIFVRFNFDRTGTDVRQTAAPYNRSATGYGPKLPTSWLVRPPGSKHWRRVYCACYSNSGTTYICHNGKEVIVEIW